MMKSEASEQSALFEWAEYANNPELRLMFHIPNGGSRNIVEAVNLKKQGVKSGVPDILLPVARKCYHGLFIEMKYGKNKISENQTNWIINLSKQDYLCKVCYGFEEARKVIENYLKGK